MHCNRHLQWLQQAPQQLRNTDIKIGEREKKKDGGMTLAERTESYLAYVSWSYQWNSADKKLSCFLCILWISFTHGHWQLRIRLASSHYSWLSSCSRDSGQTDCRNVVSWPSGRHTLEADQRSMSMCIHLNPRKIHLHFSKLPKILNTKIAHEFHRSLWLSIASPE